MRPVRSPFILSIMVWISSLARDSLSGLMSFASMLLLTSSANITSTPFLLMRSVSLPICRLASPMMPHNRAAATSTSLVVPRPATLPFIRPGTNLGLPIYCIRCLRQRRNRRYRNTMTGISSNNQRNVPCWNVNIIILEPNYG
ncbi:hypothetical protein D3C80_1299600 [compost metagenome]